MKKIFFVFIIAVAACTPVKMDINKAKSVVENLIRDIDQEKYSELSKYYTYDFIQAETIEQRTEKFKQLKQAKGDLIEFVLTDSLNEAKLAEALKIILTYKIKYSKITTKETFVIVQDEGDYRVANHSVVSVDKDK
ncbi:MAG: hypothetical protein KA792_04465 [Bacteroidales bacterium]|nr:hypothetical protein [Bacteroidales bacterium]